MAVSAPSQISFGVNIVFNSITCPLTVVLNVLVILAVKRRPRLQTNTNILLACLAATDAANGLLVQSSFVLWMILKLRGITTESVVLAFLNSSLRASLVCSSLHLIFITFERLVAIKFTVRYFSIITKESIKLTVAAIWTIAVSSELLVFITGQTLVTNFIASFVMFSCVVFVAFSYVMLFRETRRHERMIKTQQLPQEEVERFRKDSKALKTTVYVVGAVVLCLLPAAIFLFLVFCGLITPKVPMFFVYSPLVRTMGMFNSLLNPLIYCWRQQEMRKFVLRLFYVQAIYPVN